MLLFQTTAKQGNGCKSKRPKSILKEFSEIMVELVFFWTRFGNFKAALQTAVDVGFNALFDCTRVIVVEVLDKAAEMHLTCKV